MLRQLFSRKGQSEKPKVGGDVSPQLDEQGLRYPFGIMDEDEHWKLAAYLDQLFEEDFATQLSDCWLLPWDSLYQLLEEPEHGTSISLLGIPGISALRPELGSSGSLSDPNFKVFIQAWRNPATGSAISVERVGAVVRYGDATELLPSSVWGLLKAIRALHASQLESPGEATNQIGWANVRKLAKKAEAGMDGFLDKSIVVRPQRLQFKPRKTVIGGTPVIELDVSFEGQPANLTVS